MTKTFSRWLLAGAVIAAAVPLAPVRASDPIGVYAVVERVATTTIAGQDAAQVWGVFAVAVRPPAGDYKPEEAYASPRKGYLLMRCAPAQERACKAEWNDLRSVAGTSDVVGFGARWTNVPRVRDAGEAPSAPDTYATNVGVVKIGPNSAYPTLVSALKASTGR
jgi:hypothetical protein